VSYTVSQAYRNVINSGDQTHVSRIAVCNFDGSEEVHSLPFLPGASVSVDETRQSRRQLSGLSVPSVPYGAAGSWVPRTPDDMLHPQSGLELRPYRGVVLPSGQVEEVCLGVLRLTKPTYAKGTGADAGILVKFTCNDRSSAISRANYKVPYVVAAGTECALAIRSLFETRLPGLTYLQSSPFYQLPAATFGQDPTQSNDPYADGAQMAAAAGSEVFFDALGRVVQRPVAIPAQATPVTTYGGGPVVLNGNRLTARVYNVAETLDETKQFDGLILICNGPGGDPIRIQVGDCSDSAKVFMLPPTQLYPNPSLDRATNTNAANVYAWNQFQLVARSFDAPDFTAVPDGSVSPGDPVGLKEEDLGVDGVYGVSTMDIPMDVAALMHVTTRPQLQAA
jgi:Domain of unknown function (DUF5047)